MSRIKFLIIANALVVIYLLGFVYLQQPDDEVEFIPTNVQTEMEIK